MNYRAYVEAVSISRSYSGLKAVEDISFTIRDNGVYGLLGPNGAGKSTTMNIITGYLSPSSGRVSICGHDIEKEPEKAKFCIGYLPEIPPLYTEMTVTEELVFAAGLRDIRGKNALKEAERVCELTCITGVKNRLISTLSKGYRQRTGLAQALVGDPKIIILDEPTVGLDPEQIIQTRDLVRTLGKDHAVILSSHILSEISEVCDHVMMIKGGKLIADESMEDLRGRAKGTSEIVIRSRAADADTIISVLRRAGITGQAGTYRDGASCNVTVEGSFTDTETERIFTLFAANSIPLTGLYKKELSLEDIYLSLISRTGEVKEEERS